MSGLLHVIAAKCPYDEIPFRCKLNGRV